MISKQSMWQFFRHSVALFCVSGILAYAQNLRGSSAYVHGDTTEGLRQFLIDCVSAAQSNDEAQLTALIKSTEIPNYASWFRKNYPGPAESWIGPYGRELKDRQTQLRAAIHFFASHPGNFAVRKLSQDPADAHGLESGLVHSAANPLDIYSARWEPATSQSGQPVNYVLGYFYFIDGAFRWESTINTTTANRPLIRIEPIYPYPAEDKEHAGNIFVQFHLAQDGSVDKKNIEINHMPSYMEPSLANIGTAHGLSNDPKLIQAAKNAILQWQYFPPALFGKGAPQTMNVLLQMPSPGPAKQRGAAQIILIPKP